VSGRAIKIGRVTALRTDDGGIRIHRAGDRDPSGWEVPLNADDVQDLLVALDAVLEVAGPKRNAAEMRERVIGGAMELRRQIYAATGDPVTVTIGMHGGVFVAALEGRHITNEQFTRGEVEIDDGIVLRRNRW
jgi:hypothetical protein